MNVQVVLARTEVHALIRMRHSNVNVWRCGKGISVNNVSTLCNTVVPT